MPKQPRNAVQYSYNIAVLLDPLDSPVNHYDFHEAPKVNSPVGG